MGLGAFVFDQRPVGAEHHQRHAGQHHHRRGDRERRIVRRIQLPALVARALAEEEAEGRQRHPDARDRVADRRRRDDARPLDHRAAEVRADRLVGDREERQQDAGQDAERQQPAEQRHLAETLRRREQQDERHRERQGRRDDQRVAPAPAQPPPLVGEIADVGVGHRVDDERHQDREAGQRARQAEHLRVVEEDEQVPGVEIDAVGDRAGAERRLAPQRDRALERHGRATAAARVIRVRS